MLLTPSEAVKLLKDRSDIYASEFKAGPGTLGVTLPCGLRCPMTPDMIAGPFWCLTCGHVHNLRPSLGLPERPWLYAQGQEPTHGFCFTCKRDRPIDESTIDNFGCYETEADDEDREQFGPGELRLECAGCGATCKPCFG